MRVLGSAGAVVRSWVALEASPPAVAVSLLAATAIHGWAVVLNPHAGGESAPVIIAGLVAAAPAAAVFVSAGSYLAVSRSGRTKALRRGHRPWRYSIKPQFLKGERTMLRRVVALTLAVGALLGVAVSPAAAFPYRWKWRSLSSPLTVSSNGDRGHGWGRIEIAKSGSDYAVIGTGYIRKTPAGGNSVYWKLNVLTRRKSVPAQTYGLTHGSSTRSNDNGWNGYPISWAGQGPLFHNQAVSFVQVCIDRRFATDPCSTRINSGWR